ncbi:LysR family transcriptional regulator [Bacillus testis]|uniref:LysR family transcriptional regulator n=1 Tax=Bacillus testis TaxID=1622072 RepID=UPI00067E89A9|nr:LysR family transcriptional regulator [Bacillus testis]
MEFSWLQTFLTAAQCGNFRKTAEILFISQPSVTVHIHNLEKELGVRLFNRENRKVTLTEEGKRYMAHAERLLAVYQQGLSDLQSFSLGYTASFSLAISPVAADTVLPHALKRFMESHPAIELSVQVLEGKEMEDALLHDEIDLGISSVKARHSALVNELVSTEDVRLIVPHDGIDNEIAPPLDEEDILSKNLLITDNHPVYWDGLKRQIKSMYPGTRYMKVSQIHITKKFIEEGLGVSYLPLSTVRRELLEGRLLEVPPSGIQLPESRFYALMKHRHRIQNDFIRFLGQYRI